MKDSKQYIEEMFRMKSKATAPSGDGKLQISVTAVKGIYPVKGAQVTVFKGEGEQKEIIYSAFTDQSGKSPVFALLAPSREYSQDKNSEVLPYSLYNVSVFADGYRGKILMNLPIFSGVTSLQNVDLIPLSENGENSPLTENEMPDYNL